MPLDVVRLRDSDLAATRSAEECWCALLLWCASWHQMPAASLPNDDRVLASLAGFGRAVEAWRAVRDGALHGWVLCSDGRLYHPVVAEKAIEAVSKRHQKSTSGRAGAEKRWANRPVAPGQDPTASPANGTAIAGEMAVPSKTDGGAIAAPLAVPSKTDGGAIAAPLAVPSKTDGIEVKGRERREHQPLSRSALGEGFERFWSAYPRKKSKGAAEKVWAKIAPDRVLVDRIVEAANRYRSSENVTRDGGRYLQHPATWLNARGWEDEDLVSAARHHVREI